MGYTIIESDALNGLLGMAKSHAEDIKSGIAEGIYDLEDNQDLENKLTSISECERTLQGSDNLKVMVDVSTGHLQDQDLKLLEMLENCSVRTGGFPRVTAHAYGWCLFLGGDDEGFLNEIESAKSLGFSESMAHLLEYGHRHGAYILNFDADADFIDSIAVPE